MSPNVQALLQQAISLSEDERAELADLVLESLDPGEDPGAEAAWTAEAERRIVQVDDGKVTLTPWPEVKERLLKRLDGRR